MFFLGTVSPSQIILLATLISLLFSLKMDAEELNVTGNFIVAIGGIILMVAALKDYSESQQQKQDTKDEIMEEIKKLQERCKQLKKK